MSAQAATTDKAPPRALQHDSFIHSVLSQQRASRIELPFACWKLQHDEQMLQLPSSLDPRLAGGLQPLCDGVEREAARGAVHIAQAELARAVQLAHSTLVVTSK